jgi:hypothetical protein
VPAKRNGRVGQTQSALGIVFGVIGLFFCVIYLVAFAQMSSASTSRAPSSSAPSYSTRDYAPAPSPGTASGHGQEAGNYGDPLTAGGLRLTVSAPETVSRAYLGNQVCTTVTYQNVGSSQESFNPFDWKFRTADGVESSASIPWNGDKPLRSGQLAPGGKVSGQVCGDDSITKASAVVYSPGFGILHELVWS